MYRLNIMNKFFKWLEKIFKIKEIKYLSGKND